MRTRTGHVMALFLVLALLTGSLPPALPAGVAIAQSPGEYRVGTGTPEARPFAQEANTPPDGGVLPDLDQVERGLAGSPLLFIENVGQYDADARFLVRGGGGDLWLTEDSLWLTVMEPAPQADPRADRLLDDGRLGVDAAAPEPPRKGVALRLSFVGANPTPRLEPFDRSETKVSYFIGSDPEGWRPDVPVWQGVRYVDLYPGLDLEVTSESGRWAWRMVRKDALAKLDAVKLRVEGAEAVRLESGMLVIDAALGTMALPLLEALEVLGEGIANAAPHASADVIAMPFGDAGNSGAALAAEGRGLVYSTYLGGGRGEQGLSIAVGGVGGAYVTGETPSTDFPTTPGVFDRTWSGGYFDVFVCFIDYAGAGLVYSTFLGGSDSDSGAAIAVDAAGRAYVTGLAGSTDFPTTSGAYDRTHDRFSDVFVSVLGSAGTNLVFSTFLGGSHYEHGDGIAVDAARRVYVTGSTGSSDYPTTSGAFDRTHNGYYDAFVSVLNSTGGALIYSTLLGGPEHDGGYAIAVDNVGRAYVSGNPSVNYPTTPGAYDVTVNGSSDVFVTVLEPAGRDLVYSTFLGGSDFDHAWGIAVDGAGRAYVTGETSSRDYPITLGAYAASFSGGFDDAFVSVLDPMGTSLVYSTFLGGNDSETGAAISVDLEGRAYVTGVTSSIDYPTTSGAYDRTLSNGHPDAFVSVLDPAGANLVYSTFLGGSDLDAGNDISQDGVGRVYVTGYTYSVDFPATNGAYDTTFNVNSDAFVSVLGMPSAVDDLVASPAADPEGTVLAWTAPWPISDPGTATTYIVRYNSAPIDEATWASAIDVAGEPTPAPAGIPQSMTVTGLTPGQFYYFGLKTVDGQGQESELSNVAVGINCLGAGGGLSGAAAAVRDVLGAQNYCGNAFEQLYTIPRCPDGEEFCIPEGGTGGQHAFEAFADLAETARHEVDFVSMSWDDEKFINDDDDPVSPTTDDSPMVLFLRGIQRLYKHVQEDPVGYAEGVKVNILLGFRFYSETGGGDQRAYVLSALSRLGVPLTADRWEVRVAAYRDSPDQWYEFATSTHSHVKMLIVDGRSAIVTGYNMEYGYLSLTESPRGQTAHPIWDAGLRVTGPIVQDALHEYDDLWLQARGCSATSYPGGDPKSATCSDEYTVLPLVHSPEVLSVAIPETISSDTVFSLFRDKNSDHAHDAEAAIEAALRSASDSVTILQNRYMDVSDILAVTAYQRGLDDALRQGVPVRLLLSQKSALDKTNFDGAYNLISRNGNPDSLEVRFAPRYQGIHGKAVLIDELADESLLIVGSENWDFSAFSHPLFDAVVNDLAEYNLGTDSDAAASAFRDWYAWMWALSGPFTIVGVDVYIPTIVEIIESAPVQSVIRLAPGVYPIGPLTGALAATEAEATPSATIAITQTLTLAGAGPGETILECTSPDQTLFGISAPGVLLEGMTIRNCGVAVQVTSNLGREATGTLIRNVVFENNGRAVVVEGGPTLPVSLELDSNTIVGGEAGLVLDIVGTQPFTSTVRDTIFDGQSLAPVQVLSAEGAPYVYAYNLFNACGGGSCAGAWHSGELGSLSDAHDNLFDLDPLFSDREVGDYRLTLRSPAIDVGDPTESPAEYLVLDGDLDGVYRVDIGAYETESFGVFLPLVIR